MKKLLLLISFLIPAGALFSQQMADLEENKPYVNNGMEYGYLITNEKNKEVKGEDFERFEIELYVTNKSGCTGIIPLRNFTQSGGSNSDDVLVAQYNCTNATGKRLTAKSGKVEAKPFYTQVRIEDRSVQSKYRIITAQIGYAIRNGQTLSNKIIVIVPKGERPKMNCKIIFLPELQ
jgi:hypothetical protein